VEDADEAEKIGVVKGGVGGAGRRKARMISGLRLLKRGRTGIFTRLLFLGLKSGKRGGVVGVKKGGGYGAVIEV